MRCFYHEDREAVATCQQCGKGLCKECASKHNPCICRDCYSNFINRQKQQEKIVANKEKQQYIENIIIGLILAVFGPIIIFIFDFSHIFSDIDLTEKIIMRILLFGIPFGWKALSSMQLSQNKTSNSFIIMSFLFYLMIRFFILMLKLILCLYIGIPIFIYHSIRFYNIIKNKKM